MFDNIQNNLEKIQQRIRDAAIRVNRNPNTIRLIAVSKTVPVNRIQEAIEAGITLFGESYIQEARTKIESIGRDGIVWHFIGHLQTNKAKYAVRLFDMIHSVDRLSLAQELDKRAKKENRILPILIQVDIAKEATKHGTVPENLLSLLQQIAPLANLSVRGLMTMPPYFDEPENARPYFRALKNLQIRIKEAGIPNIRLEELSMGMTGDFEAAVEEGATMVRIGTAIFGPRRCNK
jgi:pyridoxal phosphate enzyme (YggS family)